MTLLSKLLVQRALATNITRKFRWDAKPDNIHSHSFRQVVTQLAMTSHCRLYCTPLTIMSRLRD